jgi:hypothetical protein
MIRSFAKIALSFGAILVVEGKKKKPPRPDEGMDKNDRFISVERVSTINITITTAGNVLHCV